MMSDLTFSSSGILSVSALTRQARELLESGFPLTWVGGEISNLTHAGSGHVYFSLKDAGSQVRCTLWRSKAQLLGWRLENGQQVELRALVTLYEARGEFQLNVESLRRAGQGDLFQRFLQLKSRLEAEGLFAAEAKRPLPVFPQRLGIVTSPQAAALRDVLSTLRRRAPHIALTLYPAPVQGAGAGERIAAALAQAAAGGSELILLCRGGGSIEDLWAFNEEIVARALRASPVPVICGVGHETDFTIADFAADLRAPTPTAAAELAAPDRDTWLTRLQGIADRLQHRAERQLADASQQLDWLASRLRHPAARFADGRERLARLEIQLQQAAARQLQGSRQRWQNAAQRLAAVRPHGREARQTLENLRLRLQHAGDEHLNRLAQHLAALDSGLRQLDPQAVLRRGYALARTADGAIVRDATQLSPGATLQLAFGRGQADATVNAIADCAENNPLLSTNQ